DDKLTGLGGDDTIYGGRGADTLDGGLGRDALYGGEHQAGAWDGWDTGRVDTYRDVFNAWNPVVDRVSPDDVRQGMAPSCAVLAALAAAAHAGIPLAHGISYLRNHKSRVRLSDDEGRPVYQTVTFDGTWTDNDPQPARDSQGRLLPEFWTILYQRAYLQQMAVDYRVLDADQWVSRTGKVWKSPQVALFTVTGWEAQWVDLRRATPLGMRNGLLHGDMLVALSLEHGVSPGVVEGHCYSVMDVFQRNGVWQVKLRNPWGTADDNSLSGSALDGKADGVVTLTWTAFARSFQGYATA